MKTDWFDTCDIDLNLYGGILDRKVICRAHLRSVSCRILLLLLLL